MPSLQAGEMRNCLQRGQCFCYSVKVLAQKIENQKSKINVFDPGRDKILGALRAGFPHHRIGDHQ